MTLTSVVAADAADATADGFTAATAINSGVSRIGRKVSLPQILADGDVALYQKIFELERQGNWTAADRETANLKDDLLKGHIQAQHYLHAGDKASYAELKAWMDEYSDQPEAAAIHDLAKARGGKSPAGLKDPDHRPVDPVSFRMVSDEDSGNWEIPDLDGGSVLSAKDRAKLKTIKQKFRQLVRTDNFDAASAILSSAEFSHLAGKIDRDQLATVMAIRYFSKGDDEQVLHWGLPAVERSGDQLAQAHWVVGLAYWRMDKPDEARSHFEAVANTRGSSWMVAAGAYWAARANLVAQKPEAVNRWLEVAAGYPRSFYGLLARRALGLSINFGWEAAALTDGDIEALQAFPAARRGFALLQLGQHDLAEQEFQGLAGTASESLSKSLLSLATASDMPDLVVRLGSTVARNGGRSHDSAAFPVPRVSVRNSP